MITTTAAFDCQSKPNHITMIGATPTIGSAETRLPSGSSPRCRKGERSIRIATMRPERAADQIARKHAARRLHEIGGQRRHGGREPPPDRRGRRQDDRGHAGEPHADLPEEEHRDAEQERRHEIAEVARVHEGNAMRRRVSRPIRPTIPTRAPESAAAVNSAAQI